MKVCCFVFSHFKLTPTCYCKLRYNLQEHHSKYLTKTKPLEMEALTYKTMRFYKCCSAICIRVSLVKALVLLIFQTFLLDDNGAYTEFHTLVTCQKGSCVRYVFAVCSYPVKLRLRMIVHEHQQKTTTTNKQKTLT